MQISRRKMLRGAGALMALPFLESLARPLGAFGASGVVKPPLRMGIFTVTGGTVLESWKIKQSGPLGKLPSILRPLESIKDQLLMVTGLGHSGKGENVNGHEHCAFLHLTGAEKVSKLNGRVRAGKSIDQAAAEVAGKQTYLSSLEMGLSNSETKYSYRGPESAVPYEADPRMVFERMFRGRKPVVPNWNRRATAVASSVRGSTKSDSYDQSVLDLVTEDARGVQRDLGRGDKQKLDEYFTSVRSVEKRIQAMEAVLRMEMLDAASPGPSKLFIPEQVTHPTMWLNNYHTLVHQDPEKHAEYIALMSDLLVLAFQTDTTRVATLAVGSDEAQFPGVVTVGYERHCHTLEHQGNSFRPEDADPIAREACRQIHAWYTGLFGELVRKMAAIDEGGSTLLDNSMLMYTSYMADGGHGRNDYPVVLAGRGGGSLKPGRVVVCQDKTPMSNLYLELLNRMGVAGDQFGDNLTSPHAAYGGRLPGLGA